MHFVRFIAEFIRPAITDYHQLLMADFANSPQYASAVKNIFYSDLTFHQFIEWHKHIDIIDFDRIQPKTMDDIFGEYGKLEDLELFECQFKYVNNNEAKHYQFFQQDTYPSFELAAASFPRPYFLIRDDFVEYLDNLIFSSLTSFRKNRKKSQIEKRILLQI
ncbi:hypothetical protein [Chitinophaga sp. LS1]|uniref:hypothetical protein n=1 Tax=Chitinophaga sp. LS1 TaxID=3051176 RepID=UPI002AAC0CE2|nr:hypothetical protein [Chitinophaga sp. LS1]WPV68093.1 hypothetical protein QQL36_05065 [Chitinophaga sp. LS1]